MTEEGTLLWEPTPAFIEGANISNFIEFLRSKCGLRFEQYSDLHRFSVSEVERFWECVWQYFDVSSERPYDRVLRSRSMPGAKWFEGSQVNYAEHVLRAATYGSLSRPAIIAYSEARPDIILDWSTLAGQVRRLATSLREMGISKGDRVASYMPNIPETVVAMLATMSIGAIWASSAPEFGVEAVLDRFQQIEPKLIFAVDGYRFNGKSFDRREHVRAIVEGLPSLNHVVWLPYLASKTRFTSEAIDYHSLLDRLEISESEFRFEKMECDEALWVLFSSGTTGVPKAIVHSHVGMLVTHLLSSLHTNFGVQSRVFFYTTTGWMVFNAMVGAMLSGAAIVTYDGSPGYPGPDALFGIVEKARATGFAASPTFVMGIQKTSLVPGMLHDLSSLEYMMVTGSPAQPEVFDWVYSSVKKDLWMCAPCGGTELCSTIVGGVPTLPVRAGEIQAPILGINAKAFDALGKEVIGEVGELVISTPAPCMPIHFWNDPDGKRYSESYFGVYPGVWRHGDYIKFNPDGSSVIYGRSDSTMNRHGVRIGTAEIYRCVEGLPEVADSIAVCVHDASDSDRMHLFLQLQAGTSFDSSLEEKIRAELRSKCSPRHVPDHLHVVKAIPYTLTGKKMEIPIRKILQGEPVEKTMSRESMRDPNALDDFVSLRKRLSGMASN